MNQQSMSGGSLFSESWESGWKDNISQVEELNYKQVSVVSLLAFLFGVISFLVFLTFWFSFICVLGIIFSLISIVLISRSEGSLTGIWFARLGFCLSIISLVAVSVFWICYDYNLRYEADQFCRAWFELFQQENNLENIPLIKTATVPYWERKDVNEPETWWKKQYENKYSHRDIHAVIDNKLFRVMLVLGKDMNISFYKTVDVYIYNDEEKVTNIYAITYKDKNENDATKSFFIKIIAERKTQIENNLNQKKKRIGWTISTLPEFTVPDEFK
jgi:Zn-dependent protease with chaperone function